MDKSWVTLPRGDPRYFVGIESFIKFVRQSNLQGPYKCPCRSCLLLKDVISLQEMRTHLIRNLMLPNYIIWSMHGEAVDEERSSPSGNYNPTMEILNDAFPFREAYEVPSIDVMNDDIEDDSSAKTEYMKYCDLLAEARKPLYPNSDKTVLESIIRAMQIKVKNQWSDAGFNDHLQGVKEMLPPDNNYPGSYREVKKFLKNLGLSYEIIHACEHGCILYYKENHDLQSCPKCGTPRYAIIEGQSTKVPNKTVRYFPLTPRLKRLYMSPHVAKEMRWHGIKRPPPNVDEPDIRHPADGEAWHSFNMEYPEFASEIRNVRLGLATDGFNPFGVTSVSHSTWPIIVMPYNLPPWLCMKKEYNILALLISGPHSPGKCLSVFMRPLIDELKMLWNTGVTTFDRHSRTSFNMKAAVMWTISDFPALGMLGGLRTKGYKTCPICLDEVDAKYLKGRMAYQGHRRWLSIDHGWRSAKNKFNGKDEFRVAPRPYSGLDILEQIESHDYPTLSLHKKFKPPRSSKKRICWTHKSILYELPYWKTLRQPYSLDVMHIEKNVFDNLIGTILALEGKTKDDHKAREGLEAQGVRPELWNKSDTGKISQAPYTVKGEHKLAILEYMKDVRYPHGYAGSLKNKVNLLDKKFIGLKTHDCHISLYTFDLILHIKFIVPLSVYTNGFKSYVAES